MSFRGRAVIGASNVLAIASTFALSGCGGGAGSEGSSILLQARPAAAARSFGSGSTEVPRVAGTYKILYSFGPSPDAYGPSNLMSAYGTLYGTTSFGGRYNLGSVFNITTGGVESVLYSFGGLPAANSPGSRLIHVGHVLYGTSGGGTGYCDDGCGTVYSVTTSGQESVLYDFKGGSDGEVPQAGPVYVGDKLYGTTENGGSSTHYCSNGCGTVYSVTLAGHENVIYRFKGGSDGATPLASLVEVGGTFYGTTRSGGIGCPGGCGTVFRVTPSGKESIVYAFKGGPNDGEAPVGNILNLHGSLYIATTYGGSGCGNIGCGMIVETRTSGKERVVYAFKGGADGATPVGDLIDVNDTMYGTTTAGGNGCRTLGCGTLFKLSTSGKESVLHRFQGKAGSDGAYLVGRLDDVGGALYGTTASGGTHDEGTMFSIQP